MYKPLCILFLLLIISATISNAQNLVFNGGFEIFDTCPSNPSTIGDLQIEHCLGWTAPTKLGTSDYFNVCNNLSTFQLAGVPQNLLGYQQPFNGSGYCGLFAWVINNASGIDFSYREYLQTKLIQPLIMGKKYYFTFHVSYNGFNYSVEKIGALFSTNDFNGNNFNPIVAFPQVVNQNGIITDSLGWTKIEGEFIADGNEEYLTIGYFEDSLTVADTLNTHNDIFISPESYYYIDGVELIEKEFEVIIPNIITPNGDGINDLFHLNFPIIKTEIFNRWGEKLFESNNDAFWDGRTTAGNEVPSGTYYYVVKTEEDIYKGFIQLLR